MSTPPPSVEVSLEPLGRRASVPVGETLLAAARSAGVQLVCACGGYGTCGRCRITLLGGSLEAPSEHELTQLTADEIAHGLRLACQAAVAGPVRIDVPAESLGSSQRLQLEGEPLSFTFDPAVIGVEVAVCPAGLRDLRSDARRLLDALPGPAALIGVPALRQLPGRLREGNWSVRVALHRLDQEIVAILPPGTPLLGLALDIGTTKIAAYLVDLCTGRTLVRAGTGNPQIAYGDDVLSRIAYADRGESERAELRSAVVEAVDALVGMLCEVTGSSREAIVDAVAVGNTAMHHLFAGLPVSQLGQAPYVAASTAGLTLLAAEVGLHLAPGAKLYLPPLIAGYVGADHTAMLLATGCVDPSGTVLALDIGTNTEISLARGERLWTCSTASGPAFEGSHISEGMRATPGAIERVHFDGCAFHVQTIDNEAPLGLCGSGILDAVAEGLDAGIIGPSGGFDQSHPLVHHMNGTFACRLVPAGDSGHQREIKFTRHDVGEIQLAKGAIRAGTELLLATAGIRAEDLDAVIVAGAFGTYLDLRSAVRVGLLPPIGLERFHQGGNAAGAGARQLLLSRQARAEAGIVARRSQYLELTTHPEFADRFAASVSFA